MGIIQRLPDDVVNRIAAGEVVVRAANAVKELIENSLDAGATEIIVTVKDGGMGLLQVQDNGKGIHKDDLDIICERFTTSKLRKFEDLQQMATYGFRGEALSSISHVAKVSIFFENRVLIKEFSECRKNVATCSTQIDEKGVCFLLVRHHQTTCNMKNSLSDGKLESIRASAGLDGTCIAAEDLFYNCPSRRKAFRNHADETNRIADVIMRYSVHRPLHYSTEVCLTSPVSSSTARGIQAKKVRFLHCGPALQNQQKTFFLFINGRLVQCPALKFAIDSLFTDRDLVCPFALVSLMIEPCRVDVNVHPTKETVMFLEKEAIIEDLQKVLDVDSFSNNSDNGASPLQSPSATKKRVDYTWTDLIAKGELFFSIYFCQIVRVDTKERRLDEFISTSSAASSSSSVDLVKILGSQEDSACEADANGQRVFEFESLDKLRKRICDNLSQPLRCVAALELLESQSAMLNDYFSIEILRLDDVDQRLRRLDTLYLAAIPSIIDGYVPQLEGLPRLLVSLVKEVDWDQEETCFDGVCRVLAQFFMIKKEFCKVVCIGLDERPIPWLAVVRDILVPRVKSHLIPPDSLKDGIVRLADLHDLYKVFERC
ncbi:unnamed protein product [Angiostrongylus costaricensis]|uniref:DNA_mis_repair domain-containing protein n=1 Tax=Angiostrongylus costaricensis TaxID=334426 RepID=A0A0R3P9T6_ANGCS|nr:unnamed protein product [Angiostrongylus costaricensis]